MLRISNTKTVFYFLLLITYSLNLGSVKLKRDVQYGKRIYHK